MTYSGTAHGDRREEESERVSECEKEEEERERERERRGGDINTRLSCITRSRWKHFVSSPDKAAPRIDLGQRGLSRSFMLDDHFMMPMPNNRDEASMD